MARIAGLFAVAVREHAAIVARYLGLRLVIGFGTIQLDVFVVNAAIKPIGAGLPDCHRGARSGTGQRPTARASCALVIDDRPFTPRRRASA